MGDQKYISSALEVPIHPPSLPDILSFVIFFFFFTNSYVLISFLALRNTHPTKAKVKKSASGAGKEDG